VKIPDHVDRQSLLPDEEKYSLVRLNFYEHPFDDDAAAKIRETDSLDGETDMDSEHFEYIAYDRYAHVYEIPQAEEDTPVLVSRLSDVDVPEPSSEPEYPEKIDTPEEAAIVVSDSESDLLERRVSMERLRDEAEEPSEVVEYVSEVEPLLNSEDDNLQQKAEVFMRKVAEEYPEKAVDISEDKAYSDDCPP
jgi:hypothetical protein